MAARTILYVEDDDGAFLVAKMVLEEMAPPVQVLRASDGDEALAMLRNLAPYQDAPKPDVILLDLNLPKKNGFEVLSDLKQSESLCAIPVIVFTTSQSQTERNASLALGAQAYLTKPSSFDLFVKVLRSACS